jgi:hypothetical protein
MEAPSRAEFLSLFPTKSTVIVFYTSGAVTEVNAKAKFLI